MQDTGERHILNGNFNNKSELYLHLMHIATYEYAEKMADNKTVLDYGCGSGYGTEMLSKNASKIIGVDISKDAVDFAKKNYSSSNLSFKTISELTDEKFDVITSFQVIEHVPNNSAYIKKLKKHLKPGGLLLISTPDKTHRLFSPFQKPWNIFHLKEYTSYSLEKVLKKEFSDVEMLKIGSENDLVFAEINRTKKQRIITLPCTLFFYPKALRVFLLKTQKQLFSLKKNLSSNSKTVAVESYNTALQFSTKDIVFQKELTHSTDLLAVCRNN